TVVMHVRAVRLTPTPSVVLRASRWPSGRALPDHAPMRLERIGSNRAVVADVQNPRWTLSSAPRQGMPGRRVADRTDRRRGRVRTEGSSGCEILNSRVGSWAAAPAGASVAIIVFARPGGNVNRYSSYAPFARSGVSGFRRASDE